MRHMQGAADMLAGETAETLGAPCGFARQDFSRAELHVLNIRHIQHHAAQLILPLPAPRGILRAARTADRPGDGLQTGHPK